MRLEPIVELVMTASTLDMDVALVLVWRKLMRMVATVGIAVPLVDRLVAVPELDMVVVRMVSLLEMLRVAIALARLKI
jgi:hypothetical protein